MLISGIQGVLFAIVTLSSKRLKDRSNFYLALLILAFALNNLQYYFLYSGIVSEALFYGAIYIPYGYIDVAFFYLYVKTFLFPEQRIQTKEKWLFVPFTVFFACAVYFKMGHALHFFSESDYVFFDKLRSTISEFGSLGYSIFVFFLSYGHIRRFKKQHPTVLHPKIFKVNLGWLKTLFLCIFLASFIWVVAFIEEMFLQVDNSIYYYFLWVVLSVMIYVLGHLGLYKYGALKERKKIRKLYVKPPPTEEINPSQSKNDNVIAFEQYVKEEKNYLDNQLSLNSVAGELGINKSYLSRLINSELNVRFSDYVNQLRVEKVQSYISDTEFGHYNLTAMGLEAGFNSRSSFHRAFKKHTGLTPSKYRKAKGL